MKKLLFILLLLSPLMANALSDANISWMAPTEREDNTLITQDEIQEFRIYYGTATGDYQNTVAVTRPAPDTLLPNSYTLSLPTGFTYYFVITTVDTEGRESLYSNEVVLPIDKYRIKKMEGVTVVEVRVTFGN